MKIFTQKTDVWQSSKCISGILRNNKLFCIKIAGCVSPILLQELYHRQFFKNFPKFYKIAAPPPPPPHHHHKFHTRLLMKNYLWITKFWFQDHVISWDKSDKICEIIFWKIFPFGVTWVNRISHKNDLMLSSVKP